MPLTCRGLSLAPVAQSPHRAFARLGAMHGSTGLDAGYELLGGQLHVTLAPGLEHQRVSKRLFTILLRYFEEGGRGEVLYAPLDVILGDDDVVQPDLVVVGDPAQLSSRGVEGAPLLLVEVVSPGRAHYDRTVKAQRYAARVTIVPNRVSDLLNRR